MLWSLMKKDLYLVKGMKGLGLGALVLVMVFWVSHSAVEQMTAQYGLSLIVHLYALIIAFMACYMLDSLIMNAEIKSKGSVALLSAMPYPRGLQVLARYLVLASPLMLCVLALLVTCAISPAVHLDILVLSAGIAFILLTIAMMLFVIYRFGPERGQIMFLVVIFGTSFGLGRLVLAIKDTAFVQGMFGAPALSALALLAIGLALYLLSLLISINIYRHRDL